MTVTIKLEPPLEHLLRQRAAATGQSTSDVMRAALRLYFEQVPPAHPCALELGLEFFGRHSGPADLASQRKQVLAEIWSEPRRAKSRPGKAR